MPNRLVDPTWFFDAIDEFEFAYDWYANNGYSIDDMGRRVLTYSKQIIRGSLQPQRSSKKYDFQNGNTTDFPYEFYCKGFYRINIDDFICYKDRWLKVQGIQDYDEYGVRQCTLQMVDLNMYKDLKDYVDYLNGDKVI